MDTGILQGLVACASREIIQFVHFCASGEIIELV